MSDHSHSAGSSSSSSSSSTNSWTLLSPEEGELDNLGPVDDGTESLGDVPSLSEDVAGATGGIKSDEIAAETVLSEEGHQVCQETSPGDGEGLIAASPTGFSPLPPHCTLLPDPDPDSQPPVIHDIVTSSPSDNNDHLGATPFVTNIASSRTPLQIRLAESESLSELEFEPDLELVSEPAPPVADRPVLDKPTDPEPLPRSSVMEDPVITEEPIVTEDPVVTEDPLIAVDPVAMEDPVVTEDPIVTVDPVVMMDPVITEDPVIALEDPVITLEDPVVTVDPVVALEDPVVALENPVAMVDPVAMVENPIIIKDPVVTEDPAVTQDPVVTEVPVVTEYPVVLDDRAPVAEPRVSISTETVAPSDLPSLAAVKDGPSAEHASVEALPGSPLPETVGPADRAGPEPAVEEEAEEMPEKELLDEAEEGMKALGTEEPLSSFDLARGETSSEEDEGGEGGLRRRNVQSFETLRPRTSEDEDEDEEAEFRMAEKTKEKRGFSVTMCIVGALVLLCLGSLFLSDDSDSAELSGGGEQTENWSSDGSQGMKEMLDKLAQENLKISQLEAMLQSQKEELDLALAAAAVKGDERGTEDLERDNARMKEDLSSLPGLKEELETLRARVTELSQLTANQEVATTAETPPGGQPEKSDLKAAEAGQMTDPKQGDQLKNQLQRQRVLLEESEKRLAGMKKGAGNRRGVREDLEKMQRRLLEHVERLDRKKPREESPQKESRGQGDGRGPWKKGDDKKERGGGGKDGGGVRDKDDEDKGARKEGRERKQHAQNSHKEAWRKHQGEWERKKADRRVDREERRQQGPWPRPAPEDSRHGGSGEHRRQAGGHRRQPRQYDHERFWRHQREKLHKKVRPPVGCGDVESCAATEALYPVELSGFEELLEGYLSKLEGAPAESREAVRKLTAEFFRDGVFVHDRVPFGEFAEDVADILEDVADLLEGDGEALEEEMEEFEREALWKFSATV